MNRTNQNRIPISVSLSPTLESENIKVNDPYNRNRIFRISCLAIVLGIAISFLAKLLIYLINFITNLSFYGVISMEEMSPAHNNLGLLVILIPAIGGIVVGLMALYGSKAIRGHGIPEAMEQILTNQSRIRPAITYLKPISSAISIGTGGPFGAEGPIIATGGALGSTLGQLLKITNNERKILLAAGATAGMAAIFGTPIAAIFLAIELLLFEFSPKSIIPVTLACITGAAFHHILFGNDPVFAIDTIMAMPSNTALAIYSLMGIVIGLLSIGITKIVYLIEDGFEKLPIHWALWPAIGGIAVGIVGFFAPRTLGVGYENITDLLAGSLTLQVVLSLCIFKFISWAIALGSGTSGGTLAPLLTIGGATGSLLAAFALYIYPESGVTLSLAALVGMSAMFAGASRAFLTSILFALESTGQANALLPLLATCGAAYIVSYFLMENTIMTEKISRRGVKTPISYEPDILEKVIVENVMQKDGMIFSEENTIDEVTNWLQNEPEYQSNYFIISTTTGIYKGIVSASSLFNKTLDGQIEIGSLIKRRYISIGISDSLRSAVELMAKENVDVIPVVSAESNSIIGILSYQNIISSYEMKTEDHTKKSPNISLKRQGLKILVHGQKIINAVKPK